LGVTHYPFCGATNGPFAEVEGLFTVLCADRQVIAVKRQRLGAGEQVPRMY
jgi:hypothetical protein